LEIVQLLNVLLLLPLPLPLPTSSLAFVYWWQGAVRVQVRELSIIIAFYGFISFVTDIEENAAAWQRRRQRSATQIHSNR